MVTRAVCWSRDLPGLEGGENVSFRSCKGDGQKHKLRQMSYCSQD